MLLKLGNRNLLQLKQISFIEAFFLIYISSIILISQLPVGALVSKIIAALFIVYYFVIEIIWNRKKLRLNPVMIILFIWLVICLFSGLKAVDSKIFFNRFFTVIQLSVIFVIGYSAILDEQIPLARITGTVIISTILVFVVGFFYKPMVTPWGIESRMSSTTGNANVLATFGAYAFLFVLQRLLHNKRKIFYVIYFLILGLILYGVLRTQSRKGLIIVPVIVLVFGVMTAAYQYQIARNKLKYFSHLLGVILLIAVISFGTARFMMNSTYFKRFEKLNNMLILKGGSTQSAFSAVLDYSTYERRKFIQHGFRMWLDHPILGTGLDNFRANINDYWAISRKAYAHNNYIELLSTVGILGFLAYYGLYLYFLFNLAHLRKISWATSVQIQTIDLLITIICSLMILEFAMVSYGSKFVWVLLLLVAAFIQRLSSELNPEHQPDQIVL